MTWAPPAGQGNRRPRGCLARSVRPDLAGPTSEEVLYFAPEPCRLHGSLPWPGRRGRSRQPLSSGTFVASSARVKHLRQSRGRCGEVCALGSKARPRPSRARTTWLGGTSLILSMGLCTCLGPHRDGNVIRGPETREPLTLADEHTRRAVEATGGPLRTLAEVDLVVLITVDAFRADQPWVGYKGIETPNLSRLASRSLVYTHAYSLANITTASLNAMLASRYPSELRREGCIFGTYDLNGALPRYLQSASVETLGAHGQALFAGRTAPSLGFQRWTLIKGVHSRLQAEGAVVGAEIADLAAAYLTEKRPLGRKAFLWSHFPDPHDSYVAHKDFPSKSVGLRSRYDSEVAYTDAAIGKVLATLEREGLRDRTAIILTGDHGEAFGEHRMLGHGFTMYEEEIRVPLMVSVPGIEPAVIDVARSTVDIAPTIVDLFGSRPPAGWRGRSLLRDVGMGAPERRTVIVDLPEMKGRTQKQAVMMGEMKVILSRAGILVFDLAQDPREHAPIAKDDPRASRAIEAARNELRRLDTVKPVACEGWVPPP